jgi:hypothetical protein
MKLSNDPIKDNKKGGQCSTYWGNRNGGENLGERDHLEDIVVDGRIILKWNLNK